MVCKEKQPTSIVSDLQAWYPNSKQVIRIQLWTRKSVPAEISDKEVEAKTNTALFNNLFFFPNKIYRLTEETQLMLKYASLYMYVYILCQNLVNIYFHKNIFKKTMRVLNVSNEYLERMQYCVNSKQSSKGQIPRHTGIWGKIQLRVSLRTIK